MLIYETTLDIGPKLKKQMLSLSKFINHLSIGNYECRNISIHLAGLTRFFRSRYQNTQNNDCSEPILYLF